MTNKKIFSICFVSVLMISCNISCNISCKRYIKSYETRHFGNIVLKEVVQECSW
ncbi:hypothetical protein VSW48_05190 (plasmid) [Borreliella burgdorferi]|uniref:hypothetical protein n=1 Tax=Borreliella burgdorferi TaxID=139 RepID=UPI003EBC683F